MSGNAARRRGRGAPSSDSASRGGAVDGPASRGGGSSVPSVGHESTIQSPLSASAASPGIVAPESQGNSSSSPNSPSTPEGRAVDPARDPARIPQPYNAFRNIDLPVALYGFTDDVSCKPSLPFNEISGNYLDLEDPNPPWNDCPPGLTLCSSMSFFFQLAILLCNLELQSPPSSWQDSSPSPRHLPAYLNLSFAHGFFFFPFSP